jgi:hypothetical protein
LPATEQMDVEMIDSLAAVITDTDGDTIAFGEAFIAGDLRGDPQQVTKQLLVRLIGVSQRFDVLARHNQDMHGSLWDDVEKCVALFVLVDGGGGNASVKDLAKDAAHGDTSVQDPVPIEGAPQRWQWASTNRT